VNPGDTAWVLASTSLVMFMTVGLAVFYGGMVRAKNVLGTVMQSFFALALVSVLWVFLAYTLAFGPDLGGVIGKLDFAGFHGVGEAPEDSLAPTIPHMAFAAFQMMFAVITPALITGAFAERMRFTGYALFSALWLIVVYAPVAHWVFSPDGWLHRLGALDFAGGTVVHINAGAAALAVILVVGRRRGFGKEAFVPHNLTLTILGAGILWFGWFGFNAGSALGANGLAASAFVATNLGAAAGALGWSAFETVKDGRATTLGAASGAVAGLVAITPASGFVGALGSIVIGLAAGLVCAWAVSLKFRFGYDDALDVVGVHMVGGVAGAMLTGIFADLAVNPAGADGLIAGGGTALLGKQALAVIVTAAFSFGASWVVAKLVDATVGLRVTSDHEVAGLDLSLHSEVGYAFGEGSGSMAPGVGYHPVPQTAHPVPVPRGGEA
jgi:Amt family ammonium transporter